MGETSAETEAASRLGWLTRPRPVTLVVLAAIFTLSVLLRLPFIDKPMGVHHDEGTARTLVHAEAWEEGPSAGGFLLRTTLNSPGDKFLGGAVDEEGNAYYYSFPPGHPLWAFLGIRAVGVEPTVFSVRIFNLLLGLLSASMIYLIVREMLRKLPDTWSRFAGVAAFTVYLYAPIVLWYQSNAYTSGSAVQPFFIGGVLLATLAYRDDTWRKYGALALGAVVFLMGYTEWLGFAFAAVVVVLALVKRRDRTLRALAIAAGVGAVMAATLVVLQYSTQLGVSGVAAQFADRYTMRSGIEGASGRSLWALSSWTRLATIYAQALLPAIFGVLGLWVWDHFAGRGKPKGFNAGSVPASVVFILAVAPVLVHHLVLFNHTVIHDFDALKTAVPLSVLFGYLVGRLLARYSRVSASALTRAIVICGAVAVLAAGLSFALFASVNSETYPQPESLGVEIAQTAQPEEVVFLDSGSYIPPSIVTHYAHRNWVAWQADPDSTMRALSAGGDRTGVLFVLDGLMVRAVGYVGTDGVVYGSRAEARATLSGNDQE